MATTIDGALLVKSTPTKVRQVLYVVYAAGGLALGAIQVAYSAAELGQPTWLTVSLAVFAFVGTSLGITAASNPTKELTTTPTEEEQHDAGAAAATVDPTGSAVYVATAPSKAE